MDKSEVSALLGRPLTTNEDTNFETYINIAIQSLEELICSPLEPVEETRIFDTREGYSTAFTDIFLSVSEVKINDDVVDEDDYSVRQWDKRSGSWYNSLVFENKFSKDDVLEVTAEWGFKEEGSDDDLGLPVDLQAVLAGLFGLITKKNKFDPTISSKQVEDFRISFNQTDLDEEFNRSYGRTLSKYSLCDIPDFTSGEVCKCEKDYRCSNH